VRPEPEHIKEFDQIYGDCDGMGILWSKADPAELTDGELLPVNFYTAKNRDGGKGEDEILFDGKQMKFRKKA